MLIGSYSSAKSRTRSEAEIVIRSGGNEKSCPISRFVTGQPKNVAGSCIQLRSDLLGGSEIRCDK